MTSFPISPLPICPARPVLRGSVLLWGLPPWTRWERGQVGVQGEGPTPAAGPRPHPMDVAGDHVLLFGGADRTQLWGPPFTMPDLRVGVGKVPAVSQGLDHNHPWEAQYSWPQAMLESGLGLP